MSKVIITMQNGDEFAISQFDDSTLMDFIGELGDVEGPLYVQLETDDVVVTREDGGEVTRSDQVSTYLNKLQISSVEVVDS